MNNKQLKKLETLSNQLKNELQEMYFSSYNFDVRVSENRVIISKDNSMLGDIMEYTKNDGFCSIFQYGISGLKYAKDEIEKMKNDLLVASKITNNIESIKSLLNKYIELAK